MKQLIKKLKKHNPKAQEQLFGQYADYLFRVGSRYIKQREECEEILSQSFLNIFNKIEHTDITEEAQLKAWMKKIVINQSLMAIRKNIRYEPTLELLEDRKESEITSDELLLEEDLIKMVNALPEGYRIVFSLFVIEGYKHDEIAEKLGISTGTSKSQLSKARRQIKEMINKTELSYEEVR